MDTHPFNRTAVGKPSGGEFPNEYDPAAAIEHYSWQTGVLTDPITIRVNIEVTSVEGNLIPTIISVYKDIDKQKVADMRTLAGFFLLSGFIGFTICGFIYKRIYHSDLSITQTRISLFSRK